MKKALSLILVFVLCLSLFACGEDQTSDDDDRYEKYEKLLRYLEKHDFDKAREELNRLEEKWNNAATDADTKPGNPSVPTDPPATNNPTTPPATNPPTTPPVQPTVPTDPPANQWQDVEITLDNICDYFKPVQVLTVERNGFGELESVYLDTYIVPRDGVRVDMEHSKLSIKYSYGCNSYPLITDEATGEISVGEVLYPQGEHYSSDTTDFHLGVNQHGEHVFGAYLAAAFTISLDETELWTIWLETICIYDVVGTIRVQGEATDERHEMIAYG